ncbi:TetR/AcrR family transcriptional regulator [Levilactobacillus sp. N40-8-2]|uniref:TetR/AcrR family transcriptional regulator n=1 Tax=Levilactobacillus muriae TaxID=3238987 RepID=UPI0038B3E212
MHKQPAVTEQTKQNFINGFIELNRKTPIEKITVKALSDRAGYNRATFYNYFTDVYQLYEDVELDVFDKMRAKIEDNMRNADDRYVYIENFTSLAFQYKASLEVIFRNPYSQHFVTQVKTYLIEYWIEKLELPKDDVTVKYQLNFYLSAMLATISHWLRNQNDMSITELAELLQTMSSQSPLSSILNRG